MVGRVERHIKEITERSRQGYISAQEAAEHAFSNGYLGVGTAVSAEGYVPQPALSTYDPASPTMPSESWRYRIETKQGGAKAVVQAGKVARTSLWLAMGGDINVTHQRFQQNRLITPENRFYPRGTYGWRANPINNVYSHHIHRDLANAVSQLPDDEEIGAIDLLRDDDTFTTIPDEPGHLASEGTHERVGVIPVRVGDVRPLIAAAAIYYYKPLYRS